MLPSADIDRAAEIAVTARVQNAGQSCIAAKRFIVHADVYDAFTERFVEAMKALKVGDPLDEDTDVGPLSGERGREDLEELVDEAVESGATVLCGAERPDGPGWFYPPTVLADITPEMRVHQEETFGPVATLYRVADLDEAIAIANDTPFGLSSNVWTRDAAEVERLVRDLDSRRRLRQRDDGLPPGVPVRRGQALRIRA